MENTLEARELHLARAFLKLQETGLSIERIAEMAGKTAAEAERLIELAKRKKKHERPGLL